MKLIRQTKAGSKYELSRREGDCLKSLLRQFPVTAPAHARISRTDTEPASREREKLLNESLAEHRAELKKLAANLLAKMKTVEKGYSLTLDPGDQETLLQILNDIRVGCWHMLGEPEELEPETTPETEREQVFYDVMNLAGYFEAALLRDFSGDLRPGHD
jgi:hypothetical protein